MTMTPSIPDQHTRDALSSALQPERRRRQWACARCECHWFDVDDRCFLCGSPGRPM